MANQYTNSLAGLLLLNDQNMANIFPSDVLDQARVLRRLYAIPASQGGTLHKFVRRMTEAGSGFRAIGYGVSNAAAYIKEMDVVCKYLDATVVRDVALAQGYRGGIGGYMQREIFLGLRASFFALEKAIFRTGISGAFAGLPAFDDYTYIGGTLVKNAGGNGGSSCWMLRTAEDGVAIVAGNDGNMSMMWDDSNPTLIRVNTNTGDLTEGYAAYQAAIGGYFALQVGSIYDAVRICNLDGTAGHKMTDALLGSALAAFPAALQPNLIVMTRACREELRASRTATTPTGKEADIPDNFQGIPIEVTDALASNETAISTSSTTFTPTTA